MGAEKESQEEDKKVLRAIKGIIRRGNDAEVRADKDGRIKASASFDLGSTYGYSAVMALFAYEYERFDKEYARECADISAIVYKNAESKYEEASVKEKRLRRTESLAL